VSNATCTSCTLVSNLLTLTGSITGSWVVGMTITGSGVPPGVTITSLGTGSGGIGTYNCSSSAANVTVAEPMVGSLSWIMPTIGNAVAPQLADLGRAAGFGLIIAAAFGGGTAGPGAEYQHGAHAAALYNAQAQSGTRIFQPVTGKQGSSVTTFVQTLPQYVEPIQPQIQKAETKTSEVSTFVTPLINAGPQLLDLTIQPWVVFPQPQQGGGFSTEYHFGTHQAQLYNSQISSQVFKPFITATALSNIVPRTLICNPQELNTDLTLQGFVKTIPLAQGWLLTMITAGPQLADLTLQSQFIPARPFLGVQAPWNPRTIVNVSQADPTQIPPNVFRPPLRVAASKPQSQVTAFPERPDYTQPQGLIIQPSLPGPSRFVQPTVIQVFEQQYDKNSYPLVVTQPTIFNPPPPFTGFYVQAVSAGFYGGRFRTPGDIFLLASAADFSDSTVDYQPPSSNTAAYGWMQKVTTQQAFDWLQSNNAPYLPPQDPNRRFIM
jgi:hypothetical protein